MKKRKIILHDKSVYRTQRGGPFKEYLRDTIMSHKRSGELSSFFLLLSTKAM